jgi:hypothetical protein
VPPPLIPWAFKLMKLSLSFFQVLRIFEFSLSCVLSQIREVILASFVTHFFSSEAFVCLLPIWLRLTPRVQGTLACVCCFCDCFCRMKKLSQGLKKIFSPGTSHHRSGSHSLSDGMLLDSRQFSSTMPLQNEAAPWSRHSVHMEMPLIDDDDDKATGQSPSQP